MKSLKILIWKIIYCVYPHIRDFILLVGLWKHCGRQPYHIGYAKKHVTVNYIKSFLEKAGFERSICAWIDDNEILSMRKRENKYQYHVRLFEDGELKGHHEYAPEGGIIKHLTRKKFTPDKAFYKKLLQNILQTNS